MPSVGENMRQRQFGSTKGYKQPGVDVSQTISPPSDWHPNIRQPFTGTPNLGPPIKSPRPVGSPPALFDPMAAAGAILGDFDPKNPKYSPLSPNPANPLNRPPEPAGYTGGASGSWGDAQPQQPVAVPPGVHGQPIPPPLPSTPPPTGPLGAIAGLGQAIGQNFQGMPAPQGPIAGIAGAIGGLGQAVGQNFQGMQMPQVAPSGAIQPPGPVPYGAGHPAQQGSALAPPGPSPTYQPPRGLPAAMQQGGIPPGPPTQMAPGAYENQLANELERQNMANAARGPLPPENPFANPLSPQGHYGAAMAQKGGLLTNEEAAALPRGKNVDGSQPLPYMPSKTVGGAYGQKGTQGYAKGDPRNIQDLIDKDKGIAQQGNFRESMLADINKRPTGGKLAPKDNTPGGDPALAEKNLLAKGYKKTEGGAFTPENPNSERINAARNMANSPERADYLAKRKEQVANRLGAPTARTIRQDKIRANEQRDVENQMGLLNPPAYAQLQGMREQGKIADRGIKSREGIARDTNANNLAIQGRRSEAIENAAGAKAAAANPTTPASLAKARQDLRDDFSNIKTEKELRNRLKESGIPDNEHDDIANEWDQSGATVWNGRTGRRGQKIGAAPVQPGTPPGPLAPPLQPQGPKQKEGLIAQQKRRIDEGGTGFSPK